MTEQGMVLPAWGTITYPSATNDKPCLDVRSQENQEQN